MPRDTDLAPGLVREIDGHLVCHDWHHPDGPLEGLAAVRLAQRDDGAAYVELLRYAKLTRGFTVRCRVPIEGETFLALADALFSPVESDDRLERVRAAALASGRYVECPHCEGAAWPRCGVCHGKGIAPIGRARASETERAEAQGARLMASESAKEAAARPLVLEGGMIVTVTDDDLAPALVGSAIAVEVGRTTKVRIGKTRPITTMSDDVRRHYREIALRLARDHRRQMREQAAPVEP